MFLIPTKLEFKEKGAADEKYPPTIFLQESRVPVHIPHIGETVVIPTNGGTVIKRIVDDVIADYVNGRITVVYV